MCGLRRRCLEQRRRIAAGLVRAARGQRRMNAARRRQLRARAARAVTDRRRGRVRRRVRPRGPPGRLSMRRPARHQSAQRRNRRRRGTAWRPGQRRRRRRPAPAGYLARDLGNVDRRLPVAQPLVPDVNVRVLRERHQLVDQLLPGERTGARAVERHVPLDAVVGGGDWRHRPGGRSLGHRRGRREHVEVRERIRLRIRRVVRELGPLFGLGRRVDGRVHAALRRRAGARGGGQRGQACRGGTPGLANGDHVRAGLTLDLQDLPANPFVRDGVLGLTAIADEFHST